MSLLLDTHVVLWWLTDDPVLAEDVKDRLDRERDTCVSAATIWEVAIKQALGKLPGPADLPERIHDCGFTPLLITAEHTMVAGRLPQVRREHPAGVKHACTRTSMSGKLAICPEAGGLSSLARSPSASWQFSTGRG